MILADTSVWIEHYRSGLIALSDALEKDIVAMHSVIIGELSIGYLPQRSSKLQDLKLLLRLPDDDLESCVAFVEKHHLYGQGLSWNDVQILFSAYQANYQLWSLDKALDKAARALGVVYKSVH